MAGDGNGYKWALRFGLACVEMDGVRRRRTQKRRIGVCGVAPGLAALQLPSLSWFPPPALFIQRPTLHSTSQNRLPQHPRPRAKTLSTLSVIELSLSLSLLRSQPNSLRCVWTLEAFPWKDSSAHSKKLGTLNRSFALKTPERSPSDLLPFYSGTKRGKEYNLGQGIKRGGG